MAWQQPVLVLATLILLSYTKILRSLIAVVYVTYLEYPEYNNTVWLYDANVNYLSGKHILLFIGAVLVFLFVFLHYTYPHISLVSGCRPYHTGGFSHGLTVLD